MFRSFALALLVVGLVAGRVSAEEPVAAEAAGKISYFQQIRPIFQAHCQGCHQPAKQGGDYVMTTFEGLVKGGESGEAAIVPGKPEKSYLIDQVVPKNGAAEMPKEKPPLAEAQIELIKAWIAAGAHDDTPMSNRDLFDMDHPPVYPAPPVINSLDFSPDGRLLAIAGYHEVLLHEVPEDPAQPTRLAARLVGLAERIEAARFSPDGKRLAVSGGNPGRSGELQIWDVAAKELLQSIPVGYDTCYGASWSPDGKLVSVGCSDNTVRAYDAATGEQKFFNLAHNDWVLDTVFGVKSDHIVTVSRDMSMKLMHVETQRFIDNITSITPGALKGGLNRVDRHPTKDEVLAAGSDGSVKLYKMYRDRARQIGDDFNLIRAYPTLPGRVMSVAFSADGARVAACSSLDGKGTVMLAQTDDAKQLAKMEVPDSGLFAVAWRPDGRIVATAGFDGQVRFIDLDGQVVHSFVPVELTAD
jgi:mono/diheme cytochrome c family protein/roadblock/LC7 domain-containing protein